MIASLAFDTVAALAIAALALAWLVRRAFRTFSSRAGGGCGCPNESVCGPKGPGAADFKAAAARAIERVNRTGGHTR